MHANNLKIVAATSALWFSLLFLAGCSVLLQPGPTPTPTRFARPVAATASTDTAPALLTPTDTADSPTDVPNDATDTPIPTSGPSPTPSVQPTPPPALAIRDDLPPMTLKDFPRPADDNGLGIHFVATGYYDGPELDKQIARMQAMHLKWALVLYADENHLSLAAQKFKDAGIMVVWRKTLRPFERYLSWQRDVDILKQIGMPPYMQLYNEPELPYEWEGRDQNMAQFYQYLFQAARDVYNAGGYPGVQFLDEDNLREFITETYARKAEPLFHRMFFVAHSYGLNHPPDYTQDTNGVLGFITFAQIFQHRLGFIPPIIVGEGGWKIDEAEDTRFPTIDDNLLRDYTLQVFGWFQTGKMSNGSPLPDYLFAFCPWMLAGAKEAGAWFDSFRGDRTPVITAVQNIPPFTRKFSWDKPN